jgi:DNA-binding MarR family transcriptional regulator
MMADEESPRAAALQACKGFMQAIFQQGAASDWAEVELTMAQFKTMMIVTTSDGAHGRELASILGVSPSTVSSIVDHLVALRLVYREEDAVDRRITHIRPTPAARTLLSQLMAAREERVDAVLARLAPEELAIVTRAFTLLRQAALAEAAERPAAATA